MNKLAVVTQKALADSLDKVGAEVISNVNKIADIQNRVKQLNTEKQELEEANQKLLDKVESKLQNYENVEDGVTTNLFEFAVNTGQAVDYPEKLKIEKVPDKYLTKSISKSAIKAAWTANNHVVPDELAVLGVKVIETKTLNCKKVRSKEVLDKVWK